MDPYSPYWFRMGQIVGMFSTFVAISILLLLRHWANKRVEDKYV